MIHIGKDQFEFKQGSEELYRRVSVREAARIQTFPDDFIFHYSRISDGYKMIGNAVPVQLAKVVGQQIKKDLAGVEIKNRRKFEVGDVLTFEEVLSADMRLPISVSA